MPNSEGPQGTTFFEGSPYWQSNVRIATGISIGGAILICIICIIALSMNHNLDALLHVAGLILLVVIGLLYLFPGGAVANFPYAVQIDRGKGIRLFAGFKQVYIPIGDICDVRKSWLQQGYVVRLRRRHGVLSSFVIHRLFGGQAEPLANAIRGEIRHIASYDSGNFD